MITIKEVDDWVTVWKDGEQVWGNHSCSITDGLEALGIPYQREYREVTDEEDGDVQDWLDAAPEVVT